MSFQCNQFNVRKGPAFSDLHELFQNFVGTKRVEFDQSWKTKNVPFRNTVIQYEIDEVKLITD